MQQSRLVTCQTIIYIHRTLQRWRSTYPVPVSHLRPSCRRRWAPLPVPVGRLYAFTKPPSTIAYRDRLPVPITRPKPEIEFRRRSGPDRKRTTTPEVDINHVIRCVQIFCNLPVFVINCVKTCRVKWLGFWLAIDKLWVWLPPVTLSHNDFLCILWSTLFGPTLWNTLPPTVRDPSLTMTQLCTLLKTMLFYRAYETLIIAPQCQYRL